MFFFLSTILTEALAYHADQFPLFNPFILDHDQILGNPETNFHSTIPIDDQDGDDLSFSSFGDNSPKTLNLNDPMLLQMATFATKQMNDNRFRYKLISLDGAEKLNQNTFRLKLNLNRMKISDDDSDNQLFCTVEVIDDNGKWQMDGFGCTAPAPVRTRRPSIQQSNTNSETRLKDLLKQLKSKRYQFDLPELPEKISTPSSSSSSNQAFDLPMELNTIPLNEDEEDRQSMFSFMRRPKMTTMKLPSSLPLMYQQQSKPGRFMPHTFQQHQGNYRYYY